VQKDGQNLIWSDGARTTHYYLRDSTCSFYLIDGVLAQVDSVLNSTGSDSVRIVHWPRIIIDRMTFLRYLEWGVTHYLNASMCTIALL